MLWKLLQQTVYTVHPMRHPIIGYLDVLNHTSNETITGFYRERYVPNNQGFVVVGDVEKAGKAAQDEAEKAKKITSDLKTIESDAGEGTRVNLPFAASASALPQAAGGQ